jgi:hypothetical protein
VNTAAPKFAVGQKVRRTATGEIGTVAAVLVEEARFVIHFDIKANRLERHATLSDVELEPVHEAGLAGGPSKSFGSAARS